jgi:hypothetical protein
MISHNEFFFFFDAHFSATADDGEGEKKTLKIFARKQTHHKSTFYSYAGSFFDSFRNFSKRSKYQRKQRYREKKEQEDCSMMVASVCVFFCSEHQMRMMSV